MEFLLDLPIIKGHILSVIIFLPLLAVALLLFVRKRLGPRWITLVAMVADFILTIPLLLRFDKGTAAMQFVERGEWIPSLNIEYYLGVDGISVIFMFLTGLIGWICVLASWTSIGKRVRQFMITLLVIQAAMMGVFASLDFFLFYIFWEAMLIPMCLIIGVWGGPRGGYTRRLSSSSTHGSEANSCSSASSPSISPQEGTFDIPLLMTKQYAFGFQAFVFVLFFIAFAIKVPMFPFHTWLPDAHVEAPTAGSIILAGVLLKMGAYGFLRFLFPMFPDASLYFAAPVTILSIIAIIYGAFLALSQEDMKKLIAYSSISHMGFITLGLFLFNKNGVEGGILQMFNHGITTGALFLCVGLIYERTHTRNLKDYGWAARRIPIYAVFLLIFSLASMGFPGTNGFMGEFLILIGAYASYKFYLFFLFIGIALGAAYMLSMYQRVSFGAAHAEHGDEDGEGHGDEDEAGHGCVRDINLREAVALIAFLVFVFWVGFRPMSFLNMMHVSVANLLAQVTGAPGF